MDDFSSTFGTEPSVEQPVDVGTNESRVSIEEIDRKLREFYDGKIVRKDLTKHIKEGANVPTYVLDYLLGKYCNSDDDAIIQRGVETVKSILANNYVCPDESHKVFSQFRQKESHTIIDMVAVSLNMKDDVYETEFSNLDVSRIPISEEYPEQYDRFLCGGIRCIVQLEYGADDEDASQRSKKSKQKDMSPISIIHKLTPIQMPTVDMDQLKEGRKHFSKEEWLDILLRSTGMEPTELTYREEWLLLTKMIPLVENNFNLCELGPRSTVKSHLYKKVSSNSTLLSSEQTTIANLFYNMGRKTMGLGSDCECKESVDTAFNFLKANGNRISGSISVSNKDYIINYQDLQGLGMTKTLALFTLVAMCSIVLQRPVQSSMVILGDFSIGGTILKVENLASTLQVCLDNGAKKILLLAASMMDLATVPPDLMPAFQLVLYSDPADAVFKALGVE